MDMLTLVKENEKGKTYQADECKILYRKVGTVSWDNDINPHEIIYLIAGKAEFTLNNESIIYEAPARIEFPANTYHAIRALTDISLVLFD